MRWKYVFHIIGALILCVGLTMILPVGWAMYYGDHTIWAMSYAMTITVLSGGAMFYFFRDPEAQRAGVSHREGMAIVALGWFAAGLFGGLPFFTAGTFESITDCVFESLSGFSTTGASVLTDIEIVPRPILFWRSLTHWLGGMGIIVFSLAILPFLGVGGMQLYKAEVPGPVPDKLKPKIKDTAMTLWKVYVLFTVLETLLLMFGGMDLFDSLCHAFGTMATGGFSTRNASVAAYDSAYIDYVITVFMFIAGVNFSLHYLLLKGKVSVFWRDPEFRFYLGLFVIFVVLLTIFVHVQGHYESIADSVRYTSFQVASILTTTGFATADYELWPGLCQAVLLFCMFVGGCAGSTGGGMKVMRIMILLKQSYQELFRLIHPRSISRVRMGRTVVSEDVISGVWGFFVLWIGLLVLAAFVVAASGVDVVTSFAASLACIGNIGPGIGGVGPTENYAFLPGLAKWALILCMMLGRLEIYTVIILFVPEFWRNSRNHRPPGGTMYKLGTTGMKWLKGVHLCAVACWIGGGVALVLLRFLKDGVADGGVLYGMNQAIHFVDMNVVVIPGAFGCLLTGLLYGAVTRWGFFRHGWMILKWVVTITAIVFGTVCLGPWEREMMYLSGKMGLSALTDPQYLRSEHLNFLWGVIQVAVLAATAFVSVFKPWKGLGKK